MPQPDHPEQIPEQLSVPAELDRRHLKRLRTKNAQHLAEIARLQQQLEAAQHETDQLRADLYQAQLKQAEQRRHITSLEGQVLELTDRVMIAEQNPLIVTGATAAIVAQQYE